MMSSDFTQDTAWHALLSHGYSPGPAQGSGVAVTSARTQRVIPAGFQLAAITGWRSMLEEWIEGFTSGSECA